MSSFRVALKAIIEKDGKFLALRRSAKEEIFENIWDIPGGRMEFGEQPIEALRREVKEETSLNIDIIKPISTWTFFLGETQVVGITYAAKYISGDVELSDEHKEFKWLTVEEFSKLNAHKGMIAEVEKYYQASTKEL